MRPFLLKFIFFLRKNYYKYLSFLFMLLSFSQLSYAEGSPANPNDLPPPPGGIPDAMQVLNRIADQIPQLTGLVYAIVAIVGLTLIVLGIIKLKHFGEQLVMSCCAWPDIAFIKFVMRACRS